MNQFKEATLRKVHGLTCPEHRQAPRLKFHGNSLRDITIRMSACCDALIAIANQKIAGA